MKIKQVTKAHNQSTKEPEIQQNYSACNQASRLKN